MNAVKILVCLCFLFVKGVVPVPYDYSLWGNSPQQLQAQPVAKHLATPKQHLPILKKTGTDNGPDYLATDDALDDEDAGSCVSVKVKITSPCLSSLHDRHKAAIFQCPSYYFNAPPAVFVQASPKYLLQGVLRI